MHFLLHARAPFECANDSIFDRLALLSIQDATHCEASIYKYFGKAICSCYFRQIVVIQVTISIQNAYDL